MIRSLLNKHGDEFLNDICATIQEHLEQNGIHGATIRHRVKSIYGIYRKMYMQNKDFEEIMIFMLSASLLIRWRNVIPRWA